MLNIFKRLSQHLANERFKKERARWLSSGASHVQNQKYWSLRTIDSAQRLLFYDHCVALSWCAKNNVAPETLLESPMERLSPEFMSWLLEKRAEGFGAQSMWGRLIQMSPDNYDEILPYITESSSAKAACEWLKCSFALGRIDGIAPIVQWIKDKPLNWFDPKRLVEPLYGSHSNWADEDSFCLVGYLMSYPSVFKWLLEHEPHLKQGLLQPATWSSLHTALQSPENNKNYPYWPGAAFTIFNKKIDPLESSFSTTVGVPEMVAAYEHSPAAQAFLLYRQWKCMPSNDMTNDLKGTDLKDACDFYRSLRGHRQEQVSSTVSLLLLAADLEYEPVKFYEHAVCVYSGNYKTVEIDPSIFGDLQLC